MSKRLNADLHEVVSPYKNSVVRYVYCALRTLLLLYKLKPRVLIVQNPSVVLGLWCLPLRFFWGFKLIVDAHNAGIYHENVFVAWLNKLLMRSADLTIVTNQALAQVVMGNRGAAFVLPDPLPNFPEEYRRLQIVPNTAMFVCSWASDEPYVNVFDAAKLTPEIAYAVTGASKGREKDYGAPLPDNVTLTGYLSDEAYERLLHQSMVVIDLTTRDNCMVCGAYEAVAAQTPLITSDNSALRAYFESGTVFCDNSTESIAAAVAAVQAEFGRYKSEITELSYLLERSWQEQVSALKLILLSK